METLTKDFPTGAIVWYNFKSPCNILYLYSGRQRVLTEYNMVDKIRYMMDVAEV